MQAFQSVLNEYYWDSRPIVFQLLIAICLCNKQLYVYSSGTLGTLDTFRNKCHCLPTDGASHFVQHRLKTESTEAYEQENEQVPEAAWNLRSIHLGIREYSSKTDPFNIPFAVSEQLSSFLPAFEICVLLESCNSSNYPNFGSCNVLFQVQIQIPVATLFSCSEIFIFLIVLTFPVKQYWC